jgi:ABC-type transport system substrate-binding protein
MTDRLPSTRVLTTAVVLTLLLVAAACGGSTSNDSSSTTVAESNEFVEDAGPPQDGGSLVWGVEAETEGLDPTAGRFAVSGQMLASSVFDPLAHLDENGEAVPYLAEEFTPNDDFTVWTIKLREGVKYHDGTEMTADDVTFVLQKYQTSAVTSKAVFDYETIQTTGPLEVQITMKQPWAAFPYVLTTQAGYMVAPSMLTPEGADNPVGTGPYKFSEWKKDDYFRAVKNTEYWQEGKPHLDSIEFRPIPDARQRAEDLISGDLDAIITNRGLDFDRLAEAPDIKMLTYSGGEETYVILNTTKEPFDNVHARRAMAYATDGARIVEEITGGKADYAAGIFAPGQSGFREDNGFLAFDLDKAKEEVALYKEQTGRPTLEFEYLAGQDFDAQALAQLLKEMWDAAGATVTISTVTQSDQVVRSVLGNYQSIQFRLFGQRDPDGDHVWLHSRSIANPPDDLISLNMAQYPNSTIDEALDRARGSNDEEIRDEAYATVERQLNENVPYIWLYRLKWVIASHDDVHGYGAAANGTVQTLGSKTWIADLWRS